MRLSIKTRFIGDLWSYLKSFVKIKTEVCEDHPEFLPTVAVLELSEEVSG